ncbi:MAG: FAD-dependent monooxygenase [Candidatus Promineifilaceae bacterium]|nr:FAD-dependent monooxygenase [Candidatus Promineifilaceae bacterium]
MTMSGRKRADNKVIVIGGGIGGLATAISLRAIGLDVQVYERAHELKEVGAGLTIWHNGIRACEHLGLREAVLQTGVSLQKAQFRTKDGSILRVLDPSEFDLGTDLPPVVVLHRADLQRILLDAVGDGLIHLDHDCIAVDEHEDGVTARFANGNEVRGDLLIGADGIHSVVRASLQGQEPPRYTGISIWRGLVPFDHPLFAAGTMFNSLGLGKRFFAGLMGDSVVFWGGTIRTEEKVLESATHRKQMAMEVYKDWHEPIPDLVAATDPLAILWDGVYDRPPLDQWGRNSITLLGDAAHLAAPLVGQGACQALEDAVWLARYLDSPRDTPSALRAFESHRQERTSMIIKSSRQTGRMLHLSNPIAVSLRNLLLKYMPRSFVTRLQMRTIEDDL